MTAPIVRHIAGDDLRRQLIGRLPELLRHLRLDAVRRASEFHIASANSPLGCSIDINARTGKWGGWAANDGGDVIHLIATFSDLSRHRRERDRNDDAAAFRWARDCMGPCKGGLIPVTRGASGWPWKEAPEGDTLGLAEGVENALAYAISVPEHRIAAALNVGNLLHLRLPPAISTLIIAADSDAPGSPAARTLRRAVDRFLAEGREVRIARCPAGIRDLNDLLLREAG
jgi:hypothetical protein